jgi:hypothetical protein
MNDNQENRKTMHEVVLAYMNTNNAKWAAIPPIVAIVGDLTTLITEADALITGKVQSSVGATKDKAAIKKELCEKLRQYMSGARAYAKRQKDNTLFQRFNFTKSQLEKLRDEQLPNTATAIITALTPLAANPATLVTPARLTELQNLITAFNAASDTPRAIIVDRSAYTQQLEPKLDETDALLKEQLDEYMREFETTDPQFFLGYRGSRVIVDN